MEKRSNNVLVVILLILLGLIIISAIVYRFIKPQKKDNDNNKTNTISYERINYDVREENGNYYIYINGAKTNDFESKDDIKVEQFKDLLITKKLEGVGVLVLDKTGNVINLESDNNYVQYDYKIDNDKLIIMYKMNRDENEWFCKVDNTDDIYSYEISYEYLNNNKFNKSDKMNTKTIISEFNDIIESCLMEKPD